jgi:predicted DNA-binding protein with PD1-like motif
MQYTEGQLGRVFVVRIDDGEDMLISLHQFISDKSIQAGSILFLGALMNGRMVTGPEDPVIPPVPHFVMFEGGWEVFGVGTIYPGEGGPHIHYHASVGRSGHALTGCLREKAITYLIIEAVILEFTGLSARREYDKKLQVHLPILGNEDGPTSPDNTDTLDAGRSNEESPLHEKNDQADDLPGELADIIRDLTGRPSS